MITECRSCGSPDLEPVIDLGRQALANALVSPDDAGQADPTYPLAVVFCAGCGLVQITETVPPEQLFADYPYFSSYSDTVVDNAADIASRLLHDMPLGTDSLVIEIASNDGYLLRHYHAAGVPVLGIEPASNIARKAADNGIETLNAFFNKALAEELAAAGRRADLMHANNVLAHVPGINDFVAGIAALLAPAGTAVIETPYVRDLVERLEFDTIYHEHLFYYSLSAAEALFRRHGLAVADVEHIPIHGGSLRLFVTHDDRPVSDRVTALLAEERTAGLTEGAYYHDFAARVARFRSDLMALLQQRRAEGRRIVGYGAAAKGSTLMGYCGIDGRHLDYVVDRSPVKQGRLMPGNHLAVRGPEALLRDRPDDVLILPWNIADEIISQQTDYAAAGGRFIVPIPEIRVV